MLTPNQRIEFQDFGYSDVLLARLDKIDQGKEYGPVSLADIIKVSRASVTRAVKYRGLKTSRPGYIKILGADYIAWLLSLEFAKISRFESANFAVQKH